MKTHQGYTTKKGTGGKCSDCGDWIEVGDEAVIMAPAQIDEDGSARATALTIHGVVHKHCFEAL